jgi:putative transposase
MSMAEDEERKRRERAQQIGLFRYMLVRDAADPSLSRRQRGAKVRELVGREHTDPFGRVLRYSRWTLDHWIRRWREGGYEALVPDVRQVQPRTPEEVLALARALKRENPDRSAAQVRRILFAQHGWAPDERTLQRMFVREGLTALSTAGKPAPAGIFGRFEATKPNELWTGDALHGEKVAGRKTYLFAFIDDHSRAIVGHRWGYAEDTVRLGAALRPALATRGVPESIYVDNGSAFVDAWLLRACARLGVKLVHSTPGRPQGRGKIERFFRTVTQEFVVEIAGRARVGQAVTDLAELNRLFTAWVETVYHRREHSETGCAPLARWETGKPFRVPTAQDLAEAFKWAETRRVDKTGMVRMQGNRYQVNPALAGQRVELVFDPFDLHRIEVRLNGTDEGLATPFQVARHSHPKARPETPEQPPVHSGIDYLALLDAQHTRDAAGKVNYSALLGDQTPPDPDHSADTEGGDEQHGEAL